MEKDTKPLKQSSYIHSYDMGLAEQHVDSTLFLLPREQKYFESESLSFAFFFIILQPPYKAYLSILR
jgi:hypothetical protein